jgi:hypothetical protein
MNLMPDLSKLSNLLGAAATAMFGASEVLELSAVVEATAAGA